MRARSRGAVRHEHGLTLVELMVVVAIVGVLMAAAVVFVKPDQYGQTTRGFADSIGAFLEGARDRGIATHAWQRIEIDDTEGLIAYQAPVTGFVKPADDAWLYVGAMARPNTKVEVVAVTDTAAIEDIAAPADGAGLPAIVEFAPDGSAQPTTIYVADEQRNRKARILIFRATGSVLVLDSW